MKKSAQVEKKKVYWDGVEIPGLMKVGELKLTKATVNVPSFKRLRKLSSEIVEIPVMELTYMIERSTQTLAFFENFFFKSEIKDAIEVRTDQYGDEIERRVWQQCECNDFRTPPFDSETPELATVTIQVIPWEIVVI